MAQQPPASPYPLIPMRDALSTIAATLQPLPPELVRLPEALHLTLAEDVTSPDAHPPFRASVKDGYAVCHPLPPDGRLALAAPSLAGAPALPPPLPPGHAAYVTTGAPVPPNATAVVMVEVCVAGADAVAIQPGGAPARGADIREAGSDLPARALVLAAGDRLGAAEIGLLAACGVARVRAHPRPVVAVFSTGDELHDDNTLVTALPPGKIRDSNSAMLVAAVREALPFCEAVHLGRIPDEESKVEVLLRAALGRYHVVVTSGGVSMGNRDFVKPVLDRIARVHFGRVLMKPGKPLTFATSGPHACAVALPGNPVSCFVCFHLAVVVAARRLAGWSETDALGSVVRVALAHEFRLDPERPEYHRARLEWSGDGWRATSTGKQASSRLLSARSADALLALPAGKGTLPEGEKVDAYLLPNLALRAWGGMPPPMKSPHGEQQ